MKSEIDTFNAVSPEIVVMSFSIPCNLVSVSPVYELNIVSERTPVTVNKTSLVPPEINILSPATNDFKYPVVPSTPLTIPTPLPLFDKFNKPSTPEITIWSGLTTNNFFSAIFSTRLYFVII